MFRYDLTEPIIQLKTPTSNNVGNSSGIETLSEYFLLQRWLNTGLLCWHSNFFFKRKEPKYRLGGSELLQTGNIFTMSGILKMSATITTQLSIQYVDHVSKTYLKGKCIFNMLFLSTDLRFYSGIQSYYQNSLSILQDLNS